MKVPNRIRELHDDLKEKYQRLTALVDQKIQDLANSKEWFHRTRIKSLESFAQKLETNFWYFQSEFEDFLGYEIIVDRIDDINLLISALDAEFEIVRQRPSDLKKTSGSPENFKFNDPRIYLRLKKKDTLPVTELHSLVFELQIKTIFSYAWAKATHDLIYKANKVSWARERVAFQVKAMIEQSEYAISNIDHATESHFPDHDQYVGIKSILSVLDRFDAVLLPKDRKRCAENIITAGEILGLRLSDTVARLTDRIDSTIINRNLNLNPFSLCFLVLQDSVSSLRDNKNSSRKILISEEVLEKMMPERAAELKRKNICVEVPQREIVNTEKSKT